jgi:GT2 family glycosyltransferase
MTTVAIAMTCHGRPATTLAALRALASQRLPPQTTTFAVLVEDGGEPRLGAEANDAFRALRRIATDGTLWWGGAMRRALDEAAQARPEFLLWLNDDVELDPDALARLLATQGDGGGIVVGAVRDPASGARSYGGQTRTWHPFRFAPVAVCDRPAPCDTFQGNVVLVPIDVHERLDGIDPTFCGAQGGADTEFGLRARALGVPIRQAPGTVGICTANSAAALWLDARLTLCDRIRAIRGPRGYPPSAWRVFASRHAGPAWRLWLLATYVLAAFRAIFAARVGIRADSLGIAILEGTLPAYRAEQLAPLAEMRDLDCVVLAGPPRKGSAGRREAKNFPLPVRFGTNIHWPGAHARIAWSAGSLSAARDGYTAAVMGFHLHDFGIWSVLLMRLLTGRPRVALNGHFRLWGGKGPVARAKCALRRALARFADAVLPYTDAGADACRRAGVAADRIFVLRNTIDVARLRAARERVTQEDVRRWRAAVAANDAAVFLFVGSFYSAKRLDVAAQAVALLRAQGRNCLFVTIGEGADRRRLETEFPPGSGAVFLPAQYDAVQVAPAFAAAHAIVVPDAVGLVAVHALGYGVPMVTCAEGRAHGPEVEYLVHERNALFAGPVTAEAMAHELARLLDEPDLRERLAQNARADSHAFDVREYARSFAAGLRRAAA